MPLPFILGAGAVIAGVAGIGSGINGAAKMKEANDTMKEAKERHEKNNKRFEKESEKTNKSMDELGKLELKILHSFSEFADVFEKIKNRPNFAEYTKEGIELPKYDGEKLKEVSVGAGVLLGGLGGAGLGAAGGFAAAGATTSAVMALGTASTGTAIASLSGAAATNATLAALGGGALAAGGGGMALGSAVLGAATLGVGLLVGGAIFSFTGGKLSDQADEAWSQMKKAEKQIDEICKYLKELKSTSERYQMKLEQVNGIYKEKLNKLKEIVEVKHHTNWNEFTQEEKDTTHNNVLLVGLLYDMCKVEIVLKGKDENEMNRVNKAGVSKSINDANNILGSLD